VVSVINQHGQLIIDLKFFVGNYIVKVAHHLTKCFQLLAGKSSFFEVRETLADWDDNDDGNYDNPAAYLISLNSIFSFSLGLLSLQY